MSLLTSVVFLAHRRGNWWQVYNFSARILFSKIFTGNMSLGHAMQQLQRCKNLVPAYERFETLLHDRY